MARSRTLAELAADAYKLADLESLTDRYPALEVFRYINQGIAETWDMLVAARGYSYYGKAFYEMGAVVSQGGNGVTMTITGAPKLGTSTSYELVAKFAAATGVGTSMVSFSYDGGTTYTYGPVLSSTTAMTLPGTGLAVTFSAGTPDADATFSSTAAKPVTVSGQTTYELPYDFYKLHGLWVSNTNGMFTPLDVLQSCEEPYLQASTEAGSGTPQYCQIRDGYYDLMPAPTDESTINLMYVPTATVLVNVTDTFDGINGWEDYCVGYAARKMLLKEGDIEMANLVTQDMNKVAGRITNMAAERSQGGPQYVQDVRGALGFKRRSNRRFPRA